MKDGRDRRREEGDREGRKKAVLRYPCEESLPWSQCSARIYFETIK